MGCFLWCKKMLWEAGLKERTGTKYLFGQPIPVISYWQEGMCSNCGKIHLRRVDYI